MSRLERLRRIVSRTTLTIVIGQILAMAALTALEGFRKKRRRAVRFPTSVPEPLDVDGDEVTVYTYGENLYNAMVEAIDGARERVFFETYIWKSDTWGRRIKDALIRAADRGVEVYVCWDAFGNMVVDPKFYRFPSHVHTLRFPLIHGLVGPQNWGRNHRKLMTVDGRIGFLGGYNIGSLYATGWRDTHARIVGPSVSELDNAYIDFWNAHRSKRQPVIDENPERSWFGQIRLHRNTPRISVYPIRNMYLEAIDRATERIWLTHAYLLPDDDLVAALRDAARRGVDVRIIVPERSNHVVADWLSRGFYARLLRSGIRLYMYQDAMVHAKTATIDGTWSTIGTANLDRLSLLGNYEVNLDITDFALAEHMEKVFAMDQANCYELRLEDWERRSWVAKLTEVFLSPWRPIF
ncbi:phospholipase D-like domain-containing protein [Tessaracoccus oleiagri]|uniref:Cardiolipin synthase n=1 Tax=Tessaracoccus oleiagri TaxID=686624 RepID=A0A1G9JMV8_9ACTN|nr:phospholipase D-like domain-containing protein [Tessaracoccus oleiagri]SDL38353.1 cardiolipin synthase [Tessaracoccus oleiagri]